MKMTGSQIIMEILLEQGVDTVFGYPGGAALNIYDTLYQYSDRISHVLTAHEQHMRQMAMPEQQGRPALFLPQAVLGLPIW